MATLDLTGRRFGRLKVLARNRPTKPGWLWNCLCDCGSPHIAKTGNLTSGKTQSCGCLKSELLEAKNATLGLLFKNNKREYHAFWHAKNRCENPADSAYKHYGRRGIKFLFASLAEFLDHIGPRPSSKHSLDRIDNDGNYEPGNVRWATMKQQANNMRHGGNAKELTGQRFGKLTVLGRGVGRKRRQIIWRCLCDCGVEKLVAGSDLRRARIGSCGFPSRHKLGSTKAKRLGAAR
jgi:hypothetical protein